ncbi:phosphatidylinositol transfer protein csr1 [Coemansia nantahalensis]|uniref:Phosphatidylinositol transfer protein csr1 n=1 Tax=Coemansia nantahalensis TaxID=2789366 RepID=A0ACC1K3A9_9FUNG|nr:phosphatidylinositol transfer protein csr1 [Coemansia nantahalensis]KAJ2772429.1 phosphatidylinositol transfer protein csr1 [Coemansia nantahalensis]
MATISNGTPATGSTATSNCSRSSSSTSIVAQYAAGRPNPAGTFGHLSGDEEELLRALWQKLLAAFKDTAPLTAAAAGGDGGAATRRSERALQPRASEPAASGWFGLGLGAAAKAEPAEYRQTVHAVAAESSRPPAFPATDKPATMRAAFWAAARCDHPDVLVLRFLRARKWQVDDALAMLLACLRWRVAEEVDWLTWHGESALNLALLRRGIGAVHKTDRLGHPVLHIPVRLNDPSAQPREQILDYTIYLMELARALLRPPVEKVCLLFDTTDIALSNMDWAFFRSFMAYLEHYYPECLGLVLIYRASWVFNKLWKLIRPLLDPVVASKVHFVNSPAELQQFIDPAALPAALGGASDFAYEYVLPAPDENAAMHDAPRRDALLAERAAACDALELATASWATADASTPDAERAALDADRSRAADRLIAASNAADPYIRARTLYHRTGVIDSQLAVHL